MREDGPLLGDFRLRRAWLPSSAVPHYKGRVPGHQDGFPACLNLIKAHYRLHVHFWMLQLPLTTQLGCKQPAFAVNVPQSRPAPSPPNTAHAPPLAIHCIIKPYRYHNRTSDRLNRCRYFTALCGVSRLFSGWFGGLACIWRIHKKLLRYVRQNYWSRKEVWRVMSGVGVKCAPSVAMLYLRRRPSGPTAPRLLFLQLGRAACVMLVVGVCGERCWRLSWLLRSCCGWRRLWDVLAQPRRTYIQR